ncbi:peptidoglycan DD-metalloendopeptidase family protein [Siphonobacter aquaeclarae]|jgi:murein DD-endopeptidase MepM/ murein hydrolase activator NlpD|uniref:Murein DD-endopeptidase MepM and murein hydrolase activator NlpD, contain LysM domain n=1 Tax=Siphonobacter aquaeclarae TaxID=563176 RepID=A0A1G9RN42_9BACT|nr:peptidoglycan DD-metalloendopeptidase family protein [Siphonobacter aquaeclarae]SDM23785.1 Murein DD-endopeptidase MepM and murein hydrolase activator NlpD, contain LysM domain [Siphonobacter aquaeclarae]
MTKFWTVILVGGLCLSFHPESFAQREKGLFKKAPSIKPKSSPEKKKAGNEFELEEEATPKLRFSEQLEPKKPLNPVVSNMDTTKIDDKTEPLPLETEEQVFDDSSGVWVTTHRYFAIWDPNTIDPYNINPLEFDETIDLQLYDEAKKQFWAAPLEKGLLTSQFGRRWGRWHSGVDLDLDTGDPVYAAFDGQVRVVSVDGGGYGKYIVVRHYNGLETLYGHLSGQLVSSGQFVKAGEKIGLGGSTGRSTGPHLHYETRYEGNPFNPLELYKFPENALKSDHYILTAHVWDYLRGGRLQYEYKTGEKSRQFRQVRWYRVRKGDTLSEIAHRTGTTITALKRLNGLRGSALSIGKKLRVK